jgi:hypothetical protein
MYTQRRRRRATTVLLAVAVAVALVGGAVGAVAGTAANRTPENGPTTDATADGPTVEVALVPANVTTTTTVAPGGNVTVEVRVRGASEGVGSVGFDVLSGNASRLAMVDATSAVDAGLASVNVTPAAARVSLAAVDAPGAGANETVTVARVTVRGVSPGTVGLSLRGAQVGYADGTDDYDVTTTNATVRVEGATGTGPAVVPGSPARDLDGDGAYEDVDGDGRLGVGDVVVLFANLDAPAVRTNPAAFDFSEDGRVGVGDVVRLFRLL